MILNWFWTVLTLCNLLISPTHNKGHILDLVFCSGVMPYNFTSTVSPISDHKPIFFNITLFLARVKPQRSVSFRNIKNIDLNVLDEMIDYSVNQCNFSTSTSDLVYFYNNSLSQILDTVAPMRTHIISFVNPLLGIILNFVIKRR